MIDNNYGQFHSIFIIKKSNPSNAESSEIDPIEHLKRIPYET